jgi:hypothetical protein
MKIAYISLYISDLIVKLNALMLTAYELLPLRWLHWCPVHTRATEMRNNFNIICRYFNMVKIT